MKIWMKTKEWFEGKFLVVRRDGTVPAWPHFVIGARDPYAPRTLRAYATEVKLAGGDAEYAASIYELADEFERYRKEHGDGDPEAKPHRKDDPNVIEAMRGAARVGVITLVWRPDPKEPPAA